MPVCYCCDKINGKMGVQKCIAYVIQQMYAIQKIQ